MLGGPGGFYGKCSVLSNLVVFLLTLHTLNAHNCGLGSSSRSVANRIHHAVTFATNTLIRKAHQLGVIVCARFRFRTYSDIDRWIYLTGF